MRRMVWPRRPHGSGVTVGVTAGVTRNVTPTEGGVLHQQQEGCYIPLFHLSPPPLGGHSRLYKYPCGKAPSPAAPRARPGRRAARCLTACSAPCSVVGGVSAVSAWTWPGAFPGGRSPVGRRPPLHARFSPGRGRLVLPRAWRGRHAGRPTHRQHHSRLVSHLRADVQAPRPPPALATFAYVRQPSHRGWRSASSGQTRRERRAGLAHDP